MFRIEPLFHMFKTDLRLNTLLSACYWQTDGATTPYNAIVFFAHIKRKCTIELRFSILDLEMPSPLRIAGIAILFCAFFLGFLVSISLPTIRALEIARVTSTLTGGVVEDSIIQIPFLEHRVSNIMIHYFSFLTIQQIVRYMVGFIGRLANTELTI